MYGADPNDFGDALQDVIGQISDFSNAAMQTSEDIRRASAYGGQQVVGGIRAGVSSGPSDSKLNFFQSAWLYGTPFEKASIVLGLAGLAFIVYSEFARR